MHQLSSVLPIFCFIGSLSTRWGWGKGGGGPLEEAGELHILNNMPDLTAFSNLVIAT